MYEPRYKRGRDHHDDFVSVYSLSKSVKMITVTYAAVIGLLALVYFVVWPVFEYFRDPKGMDIPFSLLIHGGTDAR
jgi:hypothetical protein